MALHDHTYAVIMAGGVGSRFWPMSRSGSPKQFLDILDRGRTLIQMTADRLEPMLPYDRMYVVTNVRYKEEVMAQLAGPSRGPDLVRAVHAQYRAMFGLCPPSDRQERS